MSDYTKGQGGKIAIQFTEELEGDVSGRMPPLDYKSADSPFIPGEGCAYSSSGHYSSYSPDRAFDGSTSNYWRAGSTSSPQWIQADAGDSAKVPSKFRWYVSSSRPRGFILQASNDEIDWDILVEDESPNVAGWHEWNIEATKSYRYYRWVLNSIWSSSYCIYDIELFERLPVGQERAFTVLGKEYEYTGGALIDGDYQVEKVDRYGHPVKYVENFSEEIFGEGIEINEDGIKLYKPTLSITATSCYNGSQSIEGSVFANEDDFVLATILSRNDDIPIVSDGWELLYDTYVEYTSLQQRLTFFTKKATNASTVNIVATRPIESGNSTMFLNLISISGVSNIQPMPDMTAKVLSEGGNISVPDKNPLEILIWGCSAVLWSSTAPYGDWVTTPNDLTMISVDDTVVSPRLANFIDLGTGHPTGRTFRASPKTSGGYAVVSPVKLNTAYSSLGTYAPSCIDTSSFKKDLYFRSVSDIPENTSIKIEYGTSDDQLVTPSLWHEIQEGGLLSLTGRYLWLKYILESYDGINTPVLHSVWLEEEEARDTILLTMKPFNRFNNVEGQLTVMYDQNKGSLMGKQNAIVDSFSLNFVPEGLKQTVDPNNVEHIDIKNVTAQGSFTHVYYTNSMGEENIGIQSISGNGDLLHVNDL